MPVIPPRAIIVRHAINDGAEDVAPGKHTQPETQNHDSLARVIAGDAFAAQESRSLF